jgi:tRNA (cmo5U34)-methyltransferase
VPNTDGSMADVAEQFQTGAWAFTQDVVDVFDHHVRQSVPFYDAMQDLVAQAADWLVPAGGLVADLGASTGTTVRRIMDRHPQREIRAALYDIEQPMLDKAMEIFATPPDSNRVQYFNHPIEQPLKHTDADLTVSLFTLQFMPLRDRVAAVRNARLCATETGALIIAEKVRPPDARWAEIANDVGHDWKADHGLSDQAIRAKALALRGVLTPYPESTLKQITETAGWKSPEVLFRWHSWVVMGAFATASGF